MIPPFTGAGCLPVGVHIASREEFRARFLWNAYRDRLFETALPAFDLLRAAGVRRIWIDGSFVTEKERPGDVDVLWDDAYVDYDKLDPIFDDFDNGRAAQKAQFRAEFFRARWSRK